MSEQYQRAQWPDDFDDRVIKLRSEGYSWDKVAETFGASRAAVYLRARLRNLFEPRPLRRFTPDDDALLRKAYVEQRDLREVAAEIGCSYGVLRQRIFHHHKDLITGIRTQRGTLALQRYGAAIMEFGGTPDEAAQILKKKLVEAKAAARSSAIAAKAKRAAQTIETMHHEIALGKSRNTAIFEARALGLSLEQLGQEFGVTRERIRQICDAEAIRISLEQNTAPERDYLFVSSGHV